MLSLINFSKSYGPTHILAIDNLTFRQGIYWIKGENGTGKTSLFRSLAGIIPCQGTIQFDDGVALHKNPVAYRQYVNYGEAEPIYPGFLTARDLMRFVGKTKGSKPQQQDQLATEFGIDSYYDNPCETYSSGMLKKLSLALALLGNPRVIILDEPLITLDERARKILLAQIDTRIARLGTIFIISTHQPLEQSTTLTAAYRIENKTLLPL